jgi:uncharacterized protein YjbI with pentapeptide repeats
LRSEDAKGCLSKAKGYFPHSELAFTDFSGEQTLQKRNFYGADLQGAHLMMANLNFSNLFGTVLAGADLSNAIWADSIRYKQGSVGVCIK